jgi:hypothetical protein
MPSPRKSRKSPPKETDTKWEMEISHSLPYVGGALVILVILVIGLGLANFNVIQIEFAAPRGHEAILTPTERPVEFLYLDGGRVLTYLEEIQGGTVRTEEQSRRRTDTLTATLNLQHSLEAGNSSEEEELIRRSVSPTAASSYFELVRDLEAGDQIARIKWFDYGGIRRLEEGQFVKFHAPGLRPPIYLEPYLAVRQDPTLAALFPRPVRNSAANEARIRSERRAAQRFLHQVGGDPRIVFSLRSTRPICPAVAKATEATPLDFQAIQQAALESLQCREAPRQVSVQFLLPLRYRQLTDEGSLIQDGGGEINVLGKIVRILPEHHEKRGASYIDSPTRQTWRRPLHQAIGALLCRSDPACERKARAEKDGGTAVGDAPNDARRDMEEALTKQTEIQSKGAVVVPLAIYK